jgi:hypothetical protein
MSLSTNFTDVFAVPGASSIIDSVNPATDRSTICDETLEQVQARNPGAARVSWADWRQAAIARQQTPVIFDATTREQYREMLEVLPPAAWGRGGFLVGEPTDHDVASGRPRFQMYRQRGEAFEASARPVTVPEFWDLDARS